MGRHTGRHRAQRRRPWGRIAVCLFALGSAVTAATLSIVASDPRWLRGAVIAGLVAALAPAVLPSIERDRHGSDEELRDLRRALALLRGELDAYLKLAAHVPEQRTTTLALPLIRAALAAPSSNGNGHAANGHAANGHTANGQAANGHAANGFRVIDLTETERTEPLRERA